MLEGNQYLQDQDRYVLGARATEDLANQVVQECDGDATCLAPWLTEHYVDDPEANTDPGGDDLVSLLIAASSAGDLGPVFDALTTGSCIAVPKDGSAPTIEPATSADCMGGTGLGGGYPECFWVQHPDGNVSLGWNDIDEEATRRLDRSADDGPWSEVHAVTDGSWEWLDSDPPAGTLAYRMRTEAPDGSLASTVACTRYPYDVGIDPAPLPTASSGAVGADGPGSTPPTEIPRTPSAASTTPVGAPPVCSSGAQRHEIAPTRMDATYTTVTIPVGAELHFDVENHKDPAGDNGNWLGRVDLRRIEPDGSAGAVVDSDSWTTDYYWDDDTEPAPGRTLANTTTATEFLLETRAPTVVSIRSTTDAWFELSNFSIHRSTDGELLGRPCDPLGIQQCAADGGNVYFAEPTEIGGVERSGCYHHDSCVSDLPLLLDRVSEWSCEHDELMQAALVGAGLAVVVLGAVVVAGAVAPMVVVGSEVAMAGTMTTLAATTTTPAGLTVTLGGTTAIPVAAGATTGELLVVGGVLGASTVAATGFAVEVLPTLVDRTDLSYPEYEVVDGQVTTLDASLVDQIYDRGDYEDDLDPSEPPRISEIARRTLKAALSTCLTSLTLDQAQNLAASVAPGHVVEDAGDLLVDLGSATRHLCELVPIYLPGGRTRSSDAPMGQATAHINEVLYDEPLPFTPVAHTGEQPVLPQPKWHLLNRGVRSRSRWYRTAKYGCEGTGLETNCDEWPWSATEQGGQPEPGKTQPHLRIIDASHNQFGGIDYGQFLQRCGLQRGDAFIVLPFANPFLAANPDTSGPMPAVPSVFAKPGGTCG
ncbi:MAG: hypothetical protein KDA98_11730 [Acidimicrobiales bacterium]|nr:hypothetical protein [Acidimicrobiales bacterium]